MSTAAGRPTARDHRLVRGFVVLVVGCLLILGAQLSGHVVPAPLFDGLLIVEPYRYLHPPIGARGDPTGFERSRKIGRAGQPVTGSTEETPPQAQLFTQVRDIDVPDGARRYRLTIEPVEPAGLPTTGHLVGNAYAVALTDDAGYVLNPVSGHTFTLALRAPAGVSDATISVSRDNDWQALVTFSAGIPDVYLADVTSLGTFAIVSPAPDPDCFGYYVPSGPLEEEASAGAQALPDWRGPCADGPCRRSVVAAMPPIARR